MNSVIQDNGVVKLIPESMQPLIERYIRVRQETEFICSVLCVEDYGIQTMPDVSPPKWHLAHTAWFFETFLLKPYLPEYQEFHPKFAQLFNSYYNSIGEQHPRSERGFLSRPTVSEVYQYRRYIDDAMAALLAHPNHPQWQHIERRTLLGLNHEQQHQELLLTDIKHIFAYNPLLPQYRDIVLPHGSATMSLSSKSWLAFSAGVYDIGWQNTGFAFDNEMPKHKQYLQAFRVSPRLVTNGEYLEFMVSGAYQKADLWLSEAWIEINKQGWHAPLYWQKIDSEWWYMTLAGLKKVDLLAPVSHVSFFEAAAYARWRNKRLPTEAEWEVAAKCYPLAGHFRDSNFLQPVSSSVGGHSQQFFGDVWEWTMSPYMSYPGYYQHDGPLGEYNGKFMSSQMVLRGGSCVSSFDHIRSTYRNFFYPANRWQFSGIRLAEENTQ